MHYQAKSFDGAMAKEKRFIVKLIWLFIQTWEKEDDDYKYIFATQVIVVVIFFTCLPCVPSTVTYD